MLFPNPGQFGLGRIVRDNPTFGYFCGGLLAATLVLIPVRRLLPSRIRFFFPDVRVMGVGAAAPATAWYISSMVILYWVYRVHLAKHHPRWFVRYNFISTSAAIMAGGLALLVVLIGTSTGIGGESFALGVDLGGIHGDGCSYHPAIMPQF
jgi:hypothetical protein